MGNVGSSRLPILPERCFIHFGQPLLQSFLPMDLAKHEHQRERVSGHTEGDPLVRRTTSLRVSRLGPTLQSHGQVPPNANNHACLPATELDIQCHLLDSIDHDR